MESLKSENESELTSTVGNTLSTSSNEEKNDTNDATPTSSTDASTASTASRIVSDDPISSTSSDMIEKSSSSMSQTSVDDVDKGTIATDHVADLLEINVNNEKITEDVEDLVHDLESLLGESTDSFTIPVRTVETNLQTKTVADDAIPQTSVEVNPQQEVQTKNAGIADLKLQESIEQLVSEASFENATESIKESACPERLEIDEITQTTECAQVEIEEEEENDELVDKVMDKESHEADVEEVLEVDDLTQVKEIISLPVTQEPISLAEATSNEPNDVTSEHAKDSIEEEIIQDTNVKSSEGTPIDAMQEGKEQVEIEEISIEENPVDTNCSSAESFAEEIAQETVVGARTDSSEHNPEPTEIQNIIEEETSINIQSELGTEESHTAENECEESEQCDEKIPLVSEDKCEETVSDITETHGEAIHVTTETEETISESSLSAESNDCITKPEKIVNTQSVAVIEDDALVDEKHDVIESVGDTIAVTENVDCSIHAGENSLKAQETISELSSASSPLAESIEATTKPEDIVDTQIGNIIEVDVMVEGKTLPDSPVIEDTVISEQERIIEELKEPEISDGVVDHDDNVDEKEQEDAETTDEIKDIEIPSDVLESEPNKQEEILSEAKENSLDELPEEIVGDTGEASRPSENVDEEISTQPEDENKTDNVELTSEILESVASEQEETLSKAKENSLDQLPEEIEESSGPPENIDDEMSTQHEEDNDDKELTSEILESHSSEQEETLSKAKRNSLDEMPEEIVDNDSAELSRPPEHEEEYRTDDVELTSGLLESVASEQEETLSKTEKDNLDELPEEIVDNDIEETSRPSENDEEMSTQHEKEDVELTSEILESVASEQEETLSKTEENSLDEQQEDNDTKESSRQPENIDEEISTQHEAEDKNDDVELTSEIIEPAASEQEDTLSKAEENSLDELPEEIVDNDSEEASKQPENMDEEISTQHEDKTDNVELTSEILESVASKQEEPISKATKTSLEERSEKCVDIDSDEALEPVSVQVYEKECTQHEDKTENMVFATEISESEEATLKAKENSLDETSDDPPVLVTEKINHEDIEKKDSSVHNELTSEKSESVEEQQSQSSQQEGTEKLASLAVDIETASKKSQPNNLKGPVIPMLPQLVSDQKDIVDIEVDSENVMDNRVDVSVAVNAIVEQKETGDLSSKITESTDNQPVLVVTDIIQEVNIKEVSMTEKEKLSIDVNSAECNTQVDNKASEAMEEQEEKEAILESAFDMQIQIPSPAVDKDSPVVDSIGAKESVEVIVGNTENVDSLPGENSARIVENMEDANKAADIDDLGEEMTVLAVTEIEKDETVDGELPVAAEQSQSEAIVATEDDSKCANTIALVPEIGDPGDPAEIHVASSPTVEQSDTINKCIEENCADITEETSAPDIVPLDVPFIELSSASPSLEIEAVINDLVSVEKKKPIAKVTDLEFAPLVLSEEDSDDDSVPILSLDTDEPNMPPVVISNEIDDDIILDQEPLPLIDEVLMVKPTFEELPTSSIDMQSNLETILAVAALQKIDIPKEPEPESMLSDNERREMEALQRAVESITDCSESPYVDDVNDLLDVPAMVDQESEIVGLLDENLYELEQTSLPNGEEEDSSELDIPVKVEATGTAQDVQEFSVSENELDVPSVEKTDETQVKSPINSCELDPNLPDVTNSLVDEDTLKKSIDEDLHHSSSSKIEITASVVEENEKLAVAKSPIQRDSSASEAETIAASVKEENEESVDATSSPIPGHALEFEPAKEEDLHCSTSSKIETITASVEEENEELIESKLPDSTNSPSHGETSDDTLGSKDKDSNSPKLETVGASIDKEIVEQVDPKLPDAKDFSILGDVSEVIETSKDEASDHPSSSKSETIAHSVEETEKSQLKNHTVEEIQKVIDEEEDREEATNDSLRPEELSECINEQVAAEEEEAKIEKNYQVSESHHTGPVGKEVAAEEDKIEVPEQETSVDSSGIISENQEVQPAKEKDTKVKVNERPRRHKKVDNKLEQLSINVDVPDEEKSFSPKISIKPMRIADDEVSTTSNLDSDIVKGSLKITITKQSDKLHSVLKVVESENQDLHPTEQEEPIPKLIIKSKMQQVEPQHSPKMSTRSSKQSYSPTASNQRSLSPRITIKPVMKPENKEPLSPLKIKIGLKSEEVSKKKVSIKPIQKPDDVEPSPRITIKPIPKPEVELIPRLNIKPIKKQEEDVEERERSSPKITIKPIVRPQEESQGSEEEDPVKERIVLKINKGNLPTPTKDAKKRDHSQEDDKSEKLAKITVKFSKEGGHPHIVQQAEEGSKRQHEEQGPQEKSKRQKVEVESIISTRSRHKEQAQAEGTEAKSKQKDPDNPHKHKGASHPDHQAEPKRAKKDDHVAVRARRSSSRTRQRDAVVDNADEIQIIEPQLNSPIVISEDSRSQDSSVIVLDDFKEDSASDASLLGVGADGGKGTPGRSDSVLSANSTSSVTPSPKKRGRPRKVPVEVREDFKEQEEPPPKTKPPEERPPLPAVHESGRPKRSCVGQSVCDTLGIKPRKPRGPGRGRGGKRGAGNRALLSKEPSVVNLQPDFLRSESQETIEGTDHSKIETNQEKNEGIIGDKDLTILIDDSDDVILVVEPEAVEVKASPSTRGAKRKYRSRGKRRSLDISNREVLATTSNLLVKSPQTVTSSKYVQEPEISHVVLQKSTVLDASAEESSKPIPIDNVNCAASSDGKADSATVTSTVDEVATTKDPSIEFEAEVLEEVIDKDTPVAVDELLHDEESNFPERNRGHVDEEPIKVDSSVVALDKVETKEDISETKKDSTEIKEDIPEIKGHILQMNDDISFSVSSQLEANTAKLFSSLGSSETPDQEMPASLLPLLEASKKSDSELPLVPSEVMMVDEETRMSADTSSRAQTPAKQIVAPSEMVVEESQSSVHSNGTTESGNKTPSSRPSKAPRLEVQETETLVITADLLTEYYWNGNGPFMIQEQVAQYLGIKSFKRKYPNIPRRILDMQERDHVREQGLVSENMCDLGLTSVNSADILDIMYSDFQEKYEEYCKHLRDRQAKELITKQRALSLAASQEKNKADILKQAVQSAALWNARFNKNRKDDRRACMDLQTLTVHYPKGRIKQINKPPVGHYPVAVVPGQFTDYFEDFSPTEINNLPLNTMCYENINFIPRENSEDSDSESSDSDSSSGSTSSGSDSDSSSGIDDCKLCKHTPSKKTIIK